MVIICCLCCVVESVGWWICKFFLIICKMLSCGLSVEFGFWNIIWMWWWIGNSWWWFKFCSGWLLKMMLFWELISCSSVSFVVFFLELDLFIKFSVLFVCSVKLMFFIIILWFIMCFKIFLWMGKVIWSCLIFSNVEVGFGNGIGLFDGLLLSSFCV